MRKKPRTRIHLLKSNVERRVIELELRQNAEGLYIKVMEKRLTTKDTTVQVLWLMSQLGWLVVTQIG